MISRDQVIWSYRIFLERNPENEEVIADKINRINNIENLLEEILISPEFSSQECQAKRQTRFVDDEYIKWAWDIILAQAPNKQFKKQTVNLDLLVKSLLQKRRIKTLENSSCHADVCEKILLLGNCQTDLLARVLSHMGDCKVENIREDKITGHINHRIIFKKAEKADLVITQPLLADYYGKLQTRELRKHIKNLIVIPNIHFSGLHPDLIYVGKMGKRYQSPIGDYHSSIGIAAFLEGLSPVQAIHLYRDSGLFRSAGFFEEWQHSLNELKGREFFCDISISGDIIENIIKKPLFYSSNHPSIELIVSLTKEILKYLGVDTGWVSFWRDELQSNVIYPIWTPICEYHKLAYRSPEIFFLPTSKGNEMNLATYLENSFKRYSLDLPQEAGLNPKVIKLRTILSGNQI